MVEKAVLLVRPVNIQIPRDIFMVQLNNHVKIARSDIITMVLETPVVLEVVVRYCPAIVWAKRAHVMIIEV